MRTERYTSGSQSTSPASSPSFDSKPVRLASSASSKRAPKSSSTCAKWLAADARNFAGTCSIDPAHSAVEFQIKHLGLATVKGRALVVSGVIEGGA